jgi:NAD(P) transhydrogenase subunit alpha
MRVTQGKSGLFSTFALMRAALWRENPSERRLPILPEYIPKLRALGLEVLIERSLGASIFLSDEAYQEAGAQIVPDKAQLLAQADILLSLEMPDLTAFPTASGKVLIGHLNAWRYPERLAWLQRQGWTVYALEKLPRITRAQSMDVLSSMAALAGYKAVLLAAVEYGRVMPMLTTAAGTLAPARVLVIGAGVAGLQAIATARRLGARVEAYDVRPAAREQVESLGAKFLDLLPHLKAEGTGGYARELTPEEQAQQQAALEEAIAQADILITTAALPGRPAPKIVTRQALRRMKPGSVVVDLAAETGGNCEDTIPGQTQSIQGITLIAPLNLPSTLPLHASQMLARNFYEFLRLFHQNGSFTPHLNDEILQATCLLYQGQPTETKQPA